MADKYYNKMIASGMGPKDAKKELVKDTRRLAKGRKVKMTATMSKKEVYARRKSLTSVLLGG